MKGKSRNFKKILAWVLCVANIVTFCMPAMAAEGVTTANEAVVSNIALGGMVTASVEYATMPAAYAIDGSLESRWSAEAGPEQWLQVDLGVESEIHSFRIAAENVAAQKIGQFKIEGSNDGTAYSVIYQSEDKSAEGFELDTEVTLDAPVSYRYVKVTIEKLKENAYPSVSLREFEIRGIKGEVVQNLSENVALHKTTVASSIEADTLNAGKATDGNTSTRWASKYGIATEADPHWIYVNLGSIMDVKTIRITWEYRKASAYKVQTATALTGAESDWTDVKVVNGRPSAIEETIQLEEVVKAQYVRVYVTGSTSEDPDGGTAWPTVSIYELEVYGGEPPVTLNEILGDIQLALPEAEEEQKLQITYPDFADYEGFVDAENAENYEITYNGTDYEQVIDKDLTIYKPVVDTTVKVSFKVTNKGTGAYQFKEIDVTVPGTYKQEEGNNAAPEIIPELREWKGTTGTFAPTDTSRIVITSEELKEMAEAFATDYKEITGKNISVITGSMEDVVTGDFYFMFDPEGKQGLGKEGYFMKIADGVVAVSAEDATGAFWATRTILQSLKLTGNIPNGITRDYPLYEVRGYILDVGRKTFTMDHLEQMVKEMSWYKMNDFQIHLNDNLIPLEHYSQIGEDPMQAYSGFRLESDIVEGGKAVYNGTEYTYHADLTSKDVYYTKAEFKELIETSRVYGVNIIPEIDTPAHSLALTKVLPELRHGTYGRDNDHLALADKYEDCLEYVQDIFDEYMGADLSEEEVIFDKDTIIHIGADEYSAAPEAYRKFADDMLKYVQDNGRVARIWGSLSSIKGETPVRSEGVQMNLWNFGWANIDKMYEQGFDLINCNDGNYYIVPNAGYYYDYLNDGVLYNEAINTISGISIPAGDAQMIGGAIAVWNDMTDYLDNGISEYDVYDRIKTAIPLFGAKLWGKHDRTLADTKELINELGDAPGTNFGYEVEHEGDKIALYPMDEMKPEAVRTPMDGIGPKDYLTEGKNAEIEKADGKDALKLNGGESYVTTAFTTVGLNSDLRVKVKRTSDSTEEQILFESEYGSIMAVQKGTGKVGFTRENYEYSFNYALPINEWVELEFKNAFEEIQLYVNGKLTDTIGDNETTQGRPLLATMMIPFERIGSKENSFIGYVEDVRLGVKKDYNSTMELDNAVLLANALLQEQENAELTALVEQAKGIFVKYAPTADEISALTASITAITDTMEYEKADYSEMNVYVNIVDALDLTVFTSESVAYLKSVLEGFNRDLPVGMQEVADGYAQTLAAAVHALQANTQANVNYVDNSTIKATASTYHSGEEAAKAIDGDTSTIWHTDWNLAQLPHWINLEMQEATAINAITYVPRSTGGSNGILTAYEIEVSNDGAVYTKHAAGTLAADNTTKVIEFPTVTAKHIRLKFVGAVENYGSAAELKLHKADVTADIEGLTALAAKVKAITNAGFSGKSWQALQTSIAEAEAILNVENPDANDVAVLKRILVINAAALVKGTATTGVELEAVELELEKGKTATLKATVVPENALDIAVTWESSDETVITVDENGVITAVNEGTATLTATAAGKFTATCEVMVISCQHANTAIKDAKEATCAEAGYTGDTYCTDCESIIEMGEEITKKPHNFAEEFTKDGTAHWNMCTDCEASGEKTPHTYGSWTTVEAASCMKTGKAERSCICGQKDEKEIPITHNFGKEFTKDGTAHWNTCADCGATTEKTAHTYGMWNITKAASCKEAGERTKTCTVCADVQKESIPKKAEHTYGAWNVTKAASCKEAGERTKTCTVCADVQKESIPKKTEHAYSAWRVTKVASCKEAGERTRLCMVCADVQKESIAKKTEHTWNTGVVTVKPTQDATGVKTFTCNVCGERKKEVLGKLENEEQKPVKPIAKGKTFKVKDVTYKVTKSSAKKGEVAYVKTTSKAKSIVIPKTIKKNGITYKVTSIAKNAFKNNKKVTKITLGSNVTAIGANAFQGCSALTKVTLTDKVTTIEAKAFYACSKLTNVIIPKNVKKLGASLFTNCKKVKKITIKTIKLTTKNVAKGAFKGIGKNTKIVVPSKKLEAYKTLFNSKGLSPKVRITK